MTIETILDVGHKNFAFKSFEYALTMVFLGKWRTNL